MSNKKTKLKYVIENGKIVVDVESFKILYGMEIHEDYCGGGIGTWSEMEDAIENSEMSTHYLYLEGSQWKKIVHGNVDYDFYLKKEDNKNTLLMTFSFTGIGTSQFVKPERVEDVILGDVIIEDDELKLITDDGEVHIYSR